jgi:hypothetical protein
MPSVPNLPLVALMERLLVPEAPIARLMVRAELVQVPRIAALWMVVKLKDKPLAPMESVPLLSSATVTLDNLLLSLALHPRCPTVTLMDLVLDVLQTQTVAPQTWTSNKSATLVLVFASVARSTLIVLAQRELIVWLMGLVRTAALPSVLPLWMVVYLPTDNLVAVPAAEASVLIEMGRLFAILLIVSAKILASETTGVPVDLAS